MPRAGTSSRGFTLLELLVAMSIFSLVVGMATFSLRYAFGVFRHLDAPFVEDTRRIASLRDALASSFVYIGERSDMFNRHKEFFTFFNGDANAVTFVSTKPVALTGTAVCRLSLKEGNVVLEEAPLLANGSNYQNPTLEKDLHQTPIFTNVGHLTLEYFKGDKKLSTVKEEFPTMVKITVTSDDKAQEFYCRVQSDYGDKKSHILGQHAPL